MGGNAFKDGQGEPLTVSIQREDVEPTLSHFFKAVLRPLGFDSYKMLGSTGKKSLSGDLDIAVGIGDENKTKFKKAFVQKVGQILEPRRAKAVGQLAAVMYPIVDQSGHVSDDNVQIDIMFTPTPDNTAWMMSGTGDDRVKGVYRNLLFAHIAKQRSLAQQEGGNNIKMTLSFPGGLQVKRDGDIVVPRTNDPETVLKLLGLEGAAPDDVGSFEELVDFMADSPKMREYLKTFKGYIEPHLRKDTENAERAIQYIDQALSVRESLRNIIRSALQG